VIKVAWRFLRDYGCIMPSGALLLKAGPILPFMDTKREGCSKNYLADKQIVK